MSKWKKLTQSELTVPEKQYFTEKANDAMRETKNGHYCYVGIRKLIVGCPTIFAQV